MNFREHLSLAVVITVAVVAHYQVSANKMPEIKCLGEKVDMTHFLSGFMDCAAELMSADDVAKMKDPNTPEEERKAIGKKAHEHSCVTYCQWTKHNHMLTDDGKQLNETSLPEIVKVLPQAAQEDFKTGLKKCADENSSTFSTDDNCKGYKGFEKCTHDLYKTVCKEDMPCQ
ncbi:unnamed protein product [Orchesella dallaii]|uniref:Uncharacterized protein n=1 Tax=Orchesella dallaii TaxID=48710 RepID=A0ABP1S6K9_9HEXA